MRDIVQNQLPIVAFFIDHEHAAELRAISEAIDALGAEIFEKIHADLVRGVSVAEIAFCGEFRVATALGDRAELLPLRRLAVSSWFGIEKSLG